jgi:hypothetical protein
MSGCRVGRIPQAKDCIRVPYLKIRANITIPIDNENNDKFIKYADILIHPSWIILNSNTYFASTVDRLNSTIDFVIAEANWENKNSISEIGAINILVKFFDQIFHNVETETVY